MIKTLADFEYLWSGEIESTQKVLKHITNDALHKVVHPDVRTLGRLAWHIVQTIPEMMGRTGLTVSGPEPDAPIPTTAHAIFKSYNDTAIGLLDAMKKHWTDATLEEKDDMYGQLWKRGYTLQALILHQTHHRAQLIVLMRQLGLAVPGVYGPTRDEWKQYGMEAPTV